MPYVRGIFSCLALVCAAGTLALSGTSCALRIRAANLLGGKAGGYRYYVFVANQAASTYSTYLSDPATGALTSVGTTSVPNPPKYIWADPLGRYVIFQTYDSGVGTAQLLPYKIDAATGTLTAAPGGPVSLPSYETGMGAITPDGTHLYVYHYGASSYVMGWDVDPSTGNLTAMSPSTFALSIGSPTTIAIHPTGNWIYLTDHTASPNNNIAVMDVNPTDGHLTEKGSTYLSHCDMPYDTAIINGGSNFVCVSANGGPAYAVSALDSSGVPTFLTATTSDGSFQAESTQEDPLLQGRIYNYRYLASGNETRAYDVNSVTGATTAVPGSPWNAGTLMGDGHLRFRKDGTFLYRFSNATTTSNIDILQVDSSGNVTVAPSAPAFSTGDTMGDAIALLAAPL